MSDCKYLKRQEVQEKIQCCVTSCDVVLEDGTVLKTQMRWSVEKDKEALQQLILQSFGCRECALDDITFRYIVMVHEGVIIGMTGLRFEPVYIAWELDYTCVSKDYAKEQQIILRTLLQEVLKYKGEERVYCSCWSSASLHTLLEEFGFHLVIPKYRYSHVVNLDTVKEKDTWHGCGGRCVYYKGEGCSCQEDLYMLESTFCLGAVEVRKADKYEIDRIHSFVNESMACFLGREPKEYQDILQMSKYYGEHGGNFFVAIYYGEVIGTIGVEVRGSIALLRRFYVKKEYQGQGVGSLLYQTLLQYVKIHLIGKQLYLYCGKQLASARHFYEERGWNIVTTPVEGIACKEEDNLLTLGVVLN